MQLEKAICCLSWKFMDKYLEEKGVKYEKYEIINKLRRQKLYSNAFLFIHDIFMIFMKNF